MPDEDAKLILDFLNSHGPGPREALQSLAICYGWSKDGKKVRALHRLSLALKALEHSRAAYRVQLGDAELWFPDGYTKEHGRIDVARQTAAVWKAVREEELAARRRELTALLSDKLKEADGHMENGTATFNGASYPVKYNVQKEIFILGNKYFCRLGDLRDRNKSFKNCLTPLDVEQS
jgi:hypothetical protein